MTSPVKDPCSTSVFSIKVPEKFTDKKQPRCYIPKRYILTLLGFLGMFNVYAMRVNLSVAMVAMVNSTAAGSTSGGDHYVECANLLSDERRKAPERFVGDQYNWDARTQASILGAFFYGYILTQLPGGYFSEKFGAKWLYGIGVLVTAVFSLLTPLATKLGIGAFIAVRVIEGLGEGVTFPAMNYLISQWSPVSERSRVSTVIFTGAQIGNVVSMPVSGLLSSTDLLGGWSSVFYVFGAVGCVWFLFWAVLVHESPARHPTISKSELKYFDADQNQQPKKKVTTPWLSIVKSMPVWAVVVAHFGHNFGFLILLTELPTYLNTILHYDMKNNGTLSAVPYIVQALAAWMASFVADRLRRSRRLSITAIRKICNSIGLFGPAVCLLGVSVSGCRPELIVALFSLAMALNGFIYSGFNVTHVDMSPDHAGTLFGITNAISNFCGVIGPAVVGAFTDSGATIANWSDVFYIAAGVYTVTGAFYAVFASAELQPWAVQQDADASSSKEDVPVQKLSSTTP